MTSVLLVEDNEMNRDMLTRRLAKKGFEVSAAVDGQEAVEMTTAMTPDIVIMDMSLPVMDGLDATRRIKSNPALKDIPIIVLTANATVVDRENALAAGCDEFETKPVNLPQLLDKIAVCLQSRS